MDRMTIRLYSPSQAHQEMSKAWELVKAMLISGHRMVLEVRPETRSLEQNRPLWATLTDISRQVNWYGQTLTPEEWKDCFTAALKKQKVVPGIDGGFVVCGSSTSKMTKPEMAEMQELMMAFGVEHGVEFNDSKQLIEAD